MKINLFPFSVFSVFFLFSNSLPAKTPIDYLQLVRAYADEMIENGRDIYGKETSPLFATALKRDTIVLLPYPEFQLREMNSKPGDRWNYETYFLNIPMLGKERNGSGANGNHGMEKPHKQIVSGDNPLDNLGVYKTFYLLTEVTGNPLYQQQAFDALHWFFLHTQGPAGLYPWGEHIGWDFRYDYVTYHIKGYENFVLNPYKGNEKEPVTELYQSWQHEPRGMFTEWEPFLKILAELPASENKFYKPIEKYALGIWEEHFFDKENGLYNRHGDYFGLKRGIEGSYGGDMMFPKYTGYFVDIWSLAFLYSSNNEFRNQMAHYIDKLMSANKTLHEKYGYRPSLITGGAYDTRQCLQMAYQMIKAGKRIEPDYPEIGKSAIEYGRKEIDYFCTFLGTGIEKYGSKDPETLCYAYQITNDPRLLNYFYQTVDYVTDNKDSLLRYNAGQAGKNIDCLLKAYQLSGNEKYMQEAEKQAKDAVRLYFNDDCPLPKCVPADTLTTVAGEKWRTYYYSHLGSADLMSALISLVKEKKAAKSRNHKYKV